MRSVSSWSVTLASPISPSLPVRRGISRSSSSEHRRDGDRFRYLDRSALDQAQAKGVAGLPALGKRFDYWASADEVNLPLLMALMAVVAPEPLRVARG